MLKKVKDGICAGVMIIISCAVFVSCLIDGQKQLGTILFALALLTICIKGYSLFTGKVGFILEKHGKEEFSVLLLGLLGNALATVVLGIILGYAIPSLQIKANEFCSLKLIEQQWWQTLVRAIFCGILMYVAVSIYRDHNKNVIGIIFAIPVFMLSGFEHSIADIGYFAMSHIVSFDAFLFLMIVILGNAIGAWILPVLSMTKKKSKDQAEKEKE